MKKFLLSVAIATTGLTAAAQATATFAWSDVATLTGSKQTTEQQPVVLENGKIISVTTTTGSTGFSFAGQQIDLKDEGTTISPSNLVLNGLSAGGKIEWTMNSTLGGINYNSGSIAVMPGKDLAMAVFCARFNAKGATTPDVVRFIDSKGNKFNVAMACPADYNPYKGIIMTFRPSTGEILTLEGIESSYESKTAGTTCAQPLFLQGVAATANGFYVTGYAYTETVFPGNIKFTPENIPADWNGTGSVGSGFTARFNEQGVCQAINATVITSDAREGNYLIKADGNDIYVIGMSNSNLTYFQFDSSLAIVKSAKFPFSEASNGSHNALLKALDISGNDIFVSGHLAGGFEGTDIKTTGTSSEQFGFIIDINKETAEISGGGVEPAKISGYYGAYKNEKDGSVLAVGYNMTQKVAFIQPYSTSWEKADRINLFTTTGSPAIWPSSFNQTTNTILLPGRSNAKCVLGEQTIAEGFTVFSGFLAAYDISNFTLASVEEAITDNLIPAIEVRGENGGIVINANQASSVSIYNVSGSLVRSADVAAGETRIQLPAGFYIAAGKKVIVR